MRELPKNWLTEGLIDFEYKKYLALAYLKEIASEFGAVRLYPYLSDLVFHYQNLLTIKEKKKLMYEQFPKEITKADFEKLKFQYKLMIEDDELMHEMEDILEFAIPEFRKMLEEGKNIHEYVEEHIEIHEVGLLPLYIEEGYFFISRPRSTSAKVYEYQLSIFENASEKYRAIHTAYLETIHKGTVQTFESLKKDLIKKYKKLPNPATYLVETKVDCPWEETLLPIAKRMLVKHISQKAA